MSMHRQKKIFVAGHRGLAGSAIVRALERREQGIVVTRTRAELDLCEQAQVRDFFDRTHVDEIYLAAARVGGIHANATYPAQFIYENLIVQANVIHEAWRHDVRKLLFLRSSCIYPRAAVQPMAEEALLTGLLEPTNEPYAVAKIAGIKLCESYNRQYGADFRSIMPTNLYGPGDNHHPENSHVIPALMRRFHEALLADAPQVEIWGSGGALREFLHVDDMAAASLHVMALDRDAYAAHTVPRVSHINVGAGEEHSIRNVAELIGEVVGYRGRICFDRSRPDGAPRKMMDSGRLRALGWKPTVALRDGLTETYRHFVSTAGAARL